MIGVCYIIIKSFTFDINKYNGEWYFTAATIVYSLGIILGIAFVIMYPLIFRKYKIKNGIAVLLIVIVLLFLLVCGSLNYYKDLYNGKIEYETEIYKLPVESWYEEYPDIPKEIELSNSFYPDLIINDETYTDLINNNPYDQTRYVYNAIFDETTYPHLHHIVISFYENTGIVDSVQIVYD